LSARRNASCVTIVRALLLPSAMRLFGRWNWWLPTGVARIFRVEPSPLQPAPAAVGGWPERGAALVRQVAGRRGDESPSPAPLAEQSTAAPQGREVES
jgi:hypothetical protein